MDEVLDALQTVVLKLDEISDKLSGIADKLEDLGGVYNLGDVCEHLASIETSVSLIDSSISNIDLKLG